jgi:anti-sigma regulatory factor (Ser/Thr protein kinase)
MTSPVLPAPPHDAVFRHEAWLYAGEDEFVSGAASFIRDGLAGEEPVLVAVQQRKIERLRSALGADARDVLFVDMAVMGANPARIIPAWRDFVAGRAFPGRPLRGIGEPIGPDRHGDELAECHRHEALLNVAFADTPSFRLRCPYDAELLEPAVVEEARRTHPFVVEDGTERASMAFHGTRAGIAPGSEPLSDPPATATRLEVRLDALSAVRQLVARHAARAGLGARRTADMLVAVNEIATNSVRHGGGRGVLRLWQEPGALICEVRDEGRIDDPLAGRQRPRVGQVGGYGLWLANQLCDLVQIRSLPTGSVVRLHMRRG